MKRRREQVASPTIATFEPPNSRRWCLGCSAAPRCCSDGCGGSQPSVLAAVERGGMSTEPHSVGTRTTVEARRRTRRFRQCDGDGQGTVPAPNHSARRDDRASVGMGHPPCARFRRATSRCGACRFCRDDSPTGTSAPMVARTIIGRYGVGLHCIAKLSNLKNPSATVSPPQAVTITTR
jgi:hypothetical protein